MVKSDFVERDSILCSWSCNATHDTLHPVGRFSGHLLSKFL